MHRHMKSVIITLTLAICQTACFAQAFPWNKSENWKIYALVDRNALRIPVDSLKQLQGKELSKDDLQFFLSDAKAIPRKDNPLWMGAYLMSYIDSSGNFRKFLVSTYAGFVFDDGTKTHYSLVEHKHEGWREFIENAYSIFHEDGEQPIGLLKPLY